LFWLRADKAATGTQADSEGREKQIAAAAHFHNHATALGNFFSLS